MTVRLFQAVKHANRFLFAHDLTAEFDTIHCYWEDQETVVRVFGEALDGSEDEDVSVDVVFIEPAENSDAFKFADQDIVIDESGDAEIRTLLETPTDVTRTCRIRFQMVRPMTEDDVKLQHLIDLITPT